MFLLQFDNCPFSFSGSLPGKVYEKEKMEEDVGYCFPCCFVKSMFFDYDQVMEFDLELLSNKV